MANYKISVQRILFKTTLIILSIISFNIVAAEKTISLQDAQNIAEKYNQAFLKFEPKIQKYLRWEAKIFSDSNHLTLTVPGMEFQGEKTDFFYLWNSELDQKTIIDGIKASHERMVKERATCNELKAYQKTQCLMDWTGMMLARTKDIANLFQVNYRADTSLFTSREHNTEVKEAHLKTPKPVAVTMKRLESFVDKTIKSKTLTKGLFMLTRHERVLATQQTSLAKLIHQHLSEIINSFNDEVAEHSFGFRYEKPEALGVIGLPSYLQDAMMSMLIESAQKLQPETVPVQMADEIVKRYAWFVVANHEISESLIAFLSRPQSLADNKLETELDEYMMKAKPIFTHWLKHNIPLEQLLVQLELSLKSFQTSVVLDIKRLASEYVHRFAVQQETISKKKRAIINKTLAAHQKEEAIKKMINEETKIIINYQQDQDTNEVSMSEMAKLPRYFQEAIGNTPLSKSESWQIFAKEAMLLKEAFRLLNQGLLHYNNIPQHLKPYINEDAYKQRFYYRILTKHIATTKGNDYELAKRLFYDIRLSDTEVDSIVSTRKKNRLLTEAINRLPEETIKKSAAYHIAQGLVNDVIKLNTQFRLTTSFSEGQPYLNRLKPMQKLLFDALEYYDGPLTQKDVIEFKRTTLQHVKDAIESEREEALRQAAIERESQPWYTGLYMWIPHTVEASLNFVVAGPIHTFSSDTDASFRFMRDNQMLFNNYLGGSIFGPHMLGSAEMFDQSTLDLFVTTMPVTQVVQVFPGILKSLEKLYELGARTSIGITGKMLGMDKGWVISQQHYQYLLKKDGWVKSGKYAFYATEATVGIALILAAAEAKTIAEAIALLRKPIATTLTINALTSGGKEIHDASKEKRELSASNVIGDTFIGASGSMLFMGGISVVTKTLATHGSNLAAQRFNLYVNILNEIGELGQLARMLQRASNIQEFTGAIMIGAASGLDLIDTKVLKANGKVAIKVSKEVMVKIKDRIRNMVGKDVSNEEVKKLVGESPVNHPIHINVVETTI